MGRRKIEIQPLTDDRNRTVTFTKRKAGLFKKAHELSVLCQVDVSVIIIGKKNKIYEYSSNHTNEILNEYKKNQKNIYEIKTPHNYGDYELKSRVGDHGEETHNSNRHDPIIYTHKHSSSVNNIQQRSSQSFKKGHSRSKSDNIQGGQFKQGLRKSNDNGIDDDDEDDDDDDSEDDEDDNNNNNDNETVSNTDISTNKHSLSDDIDQGPNKRIRINVDDASSASGMSPLLPKTPEMKSDNRTHTLVTPMYKRNRGSDSHNNDNKENKKDKENNANVKRPTLSLQIPQVEDDLSKSNPSTITAAESSNKSKDMSSGSSKNNVHFEESSDSINNENEKKGNDSIGSKENKITKEQINSLKNFTNNNRLLSSGYPFNSASGNPIISTPLASSFLKDRKNLYTPITTNFLNSLNNNVDTPTNQMSYFNFNGMSPTQLLTPMFPFPMSATNTSAPSNQLTDSSNNNSNTVNNTNSESSNNLGLGVVMSGNSMNNSNANNNSNTNMNNNPMNSNINTTPNGKSKSDSQFLPPMNSATSMYFPQIRMNISRTPSSLLNTTTSKSSLNLSNYNGRINNNNNTRLDTINNKESSVLNSSINKHERKDSNSSNNNNNNNNNNSNNNGKNNLTVKTDGTPVELPSLSTGELYSLPSRYVEFQSPNTLFSHDWQLNSDGTPIVSGAPPSVLTHTLSTGVKTKQSLKNELDEDINDTLEG